VLVSSGGLGRDVHPLLRAPALPGTELVLPLIASRRLLGLGEKVGRMLAAVGLHAGPDLAEVARSYASLGDAEARAAFLHTLRTVIDLGGQRVSAADRLYLAAVMPTLILWGARDPLIPVQHAGTAHRAMPGSRMEIFDDAGHFPQLDEPIRFAQVLRDFLDSTEPADIDLDDHIEQLRRMMRERNAAPEAA